EIQKQRRLGGGAVTDLMGMSLPADAAESTTAFVEYRAYRDASPVTSVAKGAPPFFLMHGDADATVPFEQSEIMEKALHDAGAEVRLLRIPGGAHGPDFPGAVNPPDYLGEMVGWFDDHLGR